MVISRKNQILNKKKTSIFKNKKTVKRSYLKKNEFNLNNDFNIEKETKNEEITLKDVNKNCNSKEKNKIKKTCYKKDEIMDKSFELENTISESSNSVQIPTTLKITQKKDASTKSSSSVQIPIKLKNTQTKDITKLKKRNSRKDTFAKSSSSTENSTKSNSTRTKDTTAKSFTSVQIPITSKDAHFKNDINTKSSSSKENFDKIKSIQKKNITKLKKSSSTSIISQPEKDLITNESPLVKNTSSLMQFHLSCKKELNELIKSFNILFYGYGNKKNILKKLFPKALIFNMNYFTLEDVLETINSKCNKIEFTSNNSSNDSTINNKYNKIKFTSNNSSIDSNKQENKNNRNSSINKKRHNSNTSILNTSYVKFTNLKEVKINNILIFIDIDPLHIKYLPSTNTIITLERLNINLSNFPNNFIMRDLTTYEDYDIDDLYKPVNHLTVINNVSKNSRIVLYTLLELNKESVLVQELFDLVKKKLFIFKKAPLFELINEFVDHKIIKIIDNEIIQLMVNKKEVAFILNNKKIE